MVDYNKAYFIPQVKVKEYESIVNIVTSTTLYDKYTDVERSEAYETLGIIQYYNGDYVEALKNLKIAIDNIYLPLKSPHRLCMIKILLGSIYYRCGDDITAKEYLFSVSQISKKNNLIEFYSISLCNLSFVNMKQSKYKEAILKARDAINQAALIYPKQSEYFLQYVRVLLSIYIKMEDYSNAENLVNEHQLSNKEKAIILAGLKFTQKDTISALVILMNYLKDPQQNSISINAPHPQLKESADHNTGLLDTTTSKETTVGVDDTELLVSISKASRDHADFLSTINDDLFETIILHNLHLFKSALNIKDIKDKEVLKLLKELSDPIEKIQNTIQGFQIKRQEVNRTHLLHIQEYITHSNTHSNTNNPVFMQSFASKSLLSSDPCYHTLYDQHPCYMNYEQSTYPALILSLLLISQFQTDLVGDKSFSINSILVQSGEIPKDFGTIASVLDQYSLQLKHSLSAVAVNQPSQITTKVVTEKDLVDIAAIIYPAPVIKPTIIPIINDEDDDFNDLLIDQKISKESKVKPSSPQHKSPRKNISTGKSTVFKNNNTDLIVKDPDLILIQRLICNYDEFKQFNNIKSSIDETIKYHKKLVNRLQQQYHINISEETARIANVINDDSTSVATGFTNQSSIIKGKEAMKQNLKKPNNNNGIIDITINHHKLSSTSEYNNNINNSSSGILSSTKEFDQLFSPISTTNVTTTSTTNKLTNKEYESKYEMDIMSSLVENVVNDNYSMISEVTILIDYIAQDQTCTWLKWAYTNCGAFSYGVLGHSCVEPLPTVGFNYSHQPTDINRMLELDNLLISPPEHLKSLNNAKTMNLDARIVLYFLLVKISVQLNMKKETGSCLLQLEELCQLYKLRKCSNIDSLFYYALALKFRIEYEEWCRAENSSNAWLIAQIEHHVLLQHHQYIGAAVATNDSEMIRNAYHKVMNLYITLSQIPYNDLEVARLAKDLIPIDEIKMIPEERIIEYIKKDFSWLHINSKHLAIRYLYDMMNISKDFIALYEE